MYLNEIEKVKETSPEELKQMLRGQEKEVREQ